MTMTNEPKNELSVVLKKPVELPFDLTQLKSPPDEIPPEAVPKKPDVLPFDLSQLLSPPDDFPPECVQMKCDELLYFDAPQFLKMSRADIPKNAVIRLPGIGMSTAVSYNTDKGIYYFQFIVFFLCMT